MRRAADCRTRREDSAPDRENLTKRRRHSHPVLTRETPNTRSEEPIIVCEVHSCSVGVEDGEEDHEKTKNESTPYLCNDVSVHWQAMQSQHRGRE